MSEITASLNGVQMPRIQKDWLNTPQENATDVITLSGGIYTDFTSIENSWTFNYESLTQTQYDTLRAAYDAQFTDYQYPTLSIPFFDLADKPVRMYINEKNIWNNCGAVQNVQFIFREADQLPSFEYLLLNGDDILLLSGTDNYLVL